MAFYESVIITRPELTDTQIENLIGELSKIIINEKGKVVSIENWGLKNLAYKMNKNKKAHYFMMNLDTEPSAIFEFERQMRINEDIIRFLTIRINSIDEKPSPLMNNKPDRSRNEFVNTEAVKITNEEV